jgi:hypothetical protein
MGNHKIGWQKCTAKSRQDFSKEQSLTGRAYTKTDVVRILRTAICASVGSVLWAHRGGSV